MRIFYFCVAFLGVLPVFGQQALTLTNDGAWCWFSDPRAIYLRGDTPVIVTGWINKSGDVYAASLEPGSGKIVQKKMYAQLEVDDHDNPAFLQLADGNLLAQYTWHSKNGGVIQNNTHQPGSVADFEEPKIFKPWSENLFKQYGRETYTYANPFQLAAENNRLYCFGRWIGFKPNFVQSADNGLTWSAPRVVITSPHTDTNNRPYVKYCSDGQSKIHLLFTDGHPNNEPLNSVYYCYYEKNAFWRADGSLIRTVDELPFHPGDATLVYKATEKSGKAWIFDIAINEKGNPVVAYVRYPNNKEHIYQYAVYDQGRWVDHTLVHAGGWFPQTAPGQTEREQNYSGGVTIDPLQPATVYFSHQVNGIFEITKATTPDLGKSWEMQPVTQHSALNNVRPFIPRYRKKADPVVLFWMQFRKYTHYTEFDSNILYLVIK